MPRRGGRRKKARTQPPEPRSGAGGAPTPEDVEKTVPRSMIVRRGTTSKPVAELCLELRKVMAPHTAEKLREKPSNTLKDFVHAAQPLGVTHLLMLTQREAHVNLRIARVPAGPTLSFKLDSFVLMKNVRALQRRPFDTAAAYATPPLIVLTNFGDASEPHVKLMRITFEAMFAPIDVTAVKLTDCRRVVLATRRDDGAVEVRHYAIRASAAGVSKTIKRIVEARKLPDLSETRDISEFVTDGANDYGSDSEVEDGDEVVLHDKFVGRGNVAKAASAIKLAELGPRLTLRLYKVQKGVCDGDVLYHAFSDKAEEEEEEEADDDSDAPAQQPKKRRQGMDNNKPRYNKNKSNNKRQSGEPAPAGKRQRRN
ncbi:Brix domain-containing protein [Pelagophyceae sp. CCMP2097]|nr:Brix domain-containing protein [Pelagophyceae sp. CCMP2097]|mmetsp:Transcript_7159/g.23311  ORF Transcript_7159/g.23311 Transcript_7159/m.23311 type:complete len:369 (+) Transcript_7159:28-1134(+)